MKDGAARPGPELARCRESGIQFLAASALRVLKEQQRGDKPATRGEWIARFCDALMSDSETSHQAVFSAMIANGISSAEIHDRYVPEAARLLGERWVRDEASFVQVTIGAGRLQRLVRARSDGGSFDLSIPLGQSILMVIPDFEDHSLGAFIAADRFRRHGLWVHMGVGLSGAEVLESLAAHSFAMVGISGGSMKSVENLTGLVDYLRAGADALPPIVIGGRVVDLVEDVRERTGADHAVTTPREAIARCGLASVAEPLPF